MVDDRKDIWPILELVPLIPRDFLPQQIEKDQRRNQLTQVYLEKQPLNGSTTSSISIVCLRLVSIHLYNM